MTTQNNGSTIPTNGKTPATVASLTPAKPEKKDPATPSALEDRLLKLNQLFELQGKHTRLIQSLQKLDEFKLKKGEENIRLTIEDENSNNRVEFTTTHPEVVIEAIAFVRATILDRKKRVEDLLII